ncbi:flagellar brake protein [Brevibacillus sp. H7]|jgi:c-di-GMP-binding flagellar brake protein YcgR|uniref:flagellar brake protein n=1 Tax=Brevibacillus sp. H7 TaxID=3349138 RepID=UPI0037FBEF07
MMLPRIGQTLRMSPVSLSGEISSHSYKSRIADLQGEVAAIELPISEKTGRTDRFEQGTECDVWYIGDDGSRYDFRTEVVGRRNDNIPMLLIKLPKKENVSRSQRRNYLRIDTSVEIAVKTEDHVRNYHFLARTVDLSGGGLSFTCSDSYRLKAKDRLRVWISLPSRSGSVAHANAVLEIIRCKLPQEKGQHQLVSGKFVQINEGDQAKIVRACYERQLELRKKGIAE